MLTLYHSEPKIPKMITNGTLRIFKLVGIEVFVHWSWLLVAAYEVNQRKGSYPSLSWNIAEYIALFAIVLLHEFGHAFACRQVGGRADKILLWPLGGVAYVSPPPKALAHLWSIAAGPLVNLLLVPILYFLLVSTSSEGNLNSYDNLNIFIRNISFINFALLVFNLLPIYPLDGGQILRSLLWLVTDARKSLRIACFIGLLGSLLIGALGLYNSSVWILIMAVFIGMQSFRGFKDSRLA